MSARAGWCWCQEMALVSCVCWASLVPRRVVEDARAGANADHCLCRDWIKHECINSRRMCSSSAEAVGSWAFCMAMAHHINLNCVCPALQGSKFYLSHGGTAEYALYALLALVCVTILPTCMQGLQLLPLSQRHSGACSLNTPLAFIGLAAYCAGPPSTTCRAAAQQSMRLMRCWPEWRRSTRAWGTAPLCRQGAVLAGGYGAGKGQRLRAVVVQARGSTLGTAALCKQGAVLVGSGCPGARKALPVDEPTGHGIIYAAGKAKVVCCNPACLQDEANAKALQALPLCRNDGDAGCWRDPALLRPSLCVEWLRGLCPPSCCALLARHTKLQLLCVDPLLSEPWPFPVCLPTCTPVLAAACCLVSPVRSLLLTGQCVSPLLICLPADQFQLLRQQLFCNSDFWPCAWG